MSEHVEAMLVVTPSGAERAEPWFKTRGFDAARTKTGFLISGDRERFERVFGVPIDRSRGELALPVPPDLQDAVSSISIGSIPHYL
jgi:hypothetical protein